MTDQKDCNDVDILPIKREFDDNDGGKKGCYINIHLLITYIVLITLNIYYRCKSQSFKKTKDTTTRTVG